MIVLWNGTVNGSIVYSPTSGMSIIPRFDEHPDGSMNIDYSILDVLPVPPILIDLDKGGLIKPEIFTHLKEGALIGYDAISNSKVFHIEI